MRGGSGSPACHAAADVAGGWLAPAEGLPGVRYVCVDAQHFALVIEGAPDAALKAVLDEMAYDSMEKWVTCTLRLP